MMRCGAEVLGGPTGGFAEGCGGVDREVGITEHFASEKDEIGLAVGHNFIGLSGVGDQADRGGGDVGLAADSGGELDLKAGTDWNLRIGDLAARRDIDQIDAVIAEEMG
jgi:hypothetical protein